MFDLLVVYSCPIVMTGDVNIHLDINDERDSMTFLKASVSYSRSRIPHIFKVEFWTLWSPDRIFRCRSSKLVCRVSILIMLSWFSNCLFLGRLFVSLTAVHERGGILMKTNSLRIYKPVLCVRHLSCFRSYLSMSFRNCTIQPWWHSWIATHRVVQLADVINLPRHGLILSVRLPSEKSGCTKDSTVVRIARMIATSGATRRDSSSSSTKRNKANIGIGEFRTVKVILRNYGAACPQCFERRNQSYRIPRSSVQNGSRKPFKHSSTEFVRQLLLRLLSKVRVVSNLEDSKLLDDAAVRRFISSAACKFCELNPAPTWIIKKYANELSPFIVKLFNTSLTSGLFPTSPKCASVTPALKKVTLDSFDLGNYRPISNLTFVSKLLEHAAQEQIVGYASENQLLPDTQSAYQKHRSTETATLEVLSDVYEAAD